jgi:mRNA-degrading endonuclease toxin of MazEF toxin-antitoxin module
VLLAPDVDGVGDECVVNLDDIHTIRLRSLSDRLTALSEERMREVEVAIKFALDMR